MKRRSFDKSVVHDVVSTQIAESDVSLASHNPAYSDHAEIDNEIRKFCISQYNLHLATDGAGWLREMVQLYACLYETNSQHFYDNLDEVMFLYNLQDTPKNLSTRDIDWRKIKTILDQHAVRLKVNIWYSENSDVEKLDDYLKVQLETKYKSRFSLGCVHYLREWALKTYYINNIKVEVFVEESSDWGPEPNSPRHLICSLDIIEWINKWMEVESCK